MPNWRERNSATGTLSPSTTEISSTRLQVETIMHSVTPGVAARARVVSASSSRPMAIFSRSAMGAVLWFTPMRVNVIGDRTCAPG